MDLPLDFAQEVKQTWHRFLQRTEPLRPDLHRFCRSLTGSTWDAEDLLQDTLLRAFGKLAEVSHSIDNPRAYLFRIASNLWTDRFRRGEAVAPDSHPADGNPERAVEVRDAARHLLRLLPSQERAAIVLKDVFDFRLEEIATVLQTTTGAIKSALHRGREKLAAPVPLRPPAPPSESLLDQFVTAFNARDLDRLAALLREDAVVEVVGIGASYGRSAARESSLYYSLYLEKGEPRAEQRSYLDESIVLIWYALDPSRPIVRDVLRFEEVEGRISRMRFFAFCPETMTEVAAALRTVMKPNGYGAWAPEFLELQKREEFERWIEGGANQPSTALLRR